MSLNYYNSNITYYRGDRVFFNGKNYKSNKDSNINHIPECNEMNLLDAGDLQKLWWILD